MVVDKYTHRMGGVCKNILWRLTREQPVPAAFFLIRRVLYAVWRRKNLHKFTRNPAGWNIIRGKYGDHESAGDDDRLG